MTLKNDTPVEKTMIEKYHEEQCNRMAYKPPVVKMLDKSDVNHWSAADAKLLLDTVRITAPYTLEQLKKMQVFVGLLIEIKEPKGSAS